MSWHLNSFRGIVLAALLTGGAVSAAANVLVVRSSGPSAKSYPPGRSLADNARIPLRAGDTLVVLDARGTRTFRGPGSFSPSAAVQTGTVRNAPGGTGRRTRIGAVRSAGIVPESPTTIWHIDVSQSGTMCLAGSTPTMLWRADSRNTAKLTIRAADGSVRELVWPAGSSTIAWPADLPIREAEYQLRMAGSAVPSRLQFKTLGGLPETVPGIAEALIKAGCQEQLDLLIDTTAPAT